MLNKSLDKTIIHLVLIALLGLLAYSNTFNASFHFDDYPNITKNPLIRSLEYFVHPTKASPYEFYDMFKSRFVGYLTFALDYELHGLDVRGYHVVNLLIHMLNALLVYFIVLWTFRTPFLRGASALEKNAKYIALFSALMFVTHPVQAEAVTYIVQRFSSLAATFYLLSLAAYIRSRLSMEENRRQLAFCGVSLVAAMLAMKTKETAFTLPLVIALYEFLFFEGRIKKRAIHLVPLFLTMLIIPLSLIDMDRPLGDMLAEAGDATRLDTDMSRADYLFTQFRVIVTYIRLLFLPVGLHLDYDYPIFHSFFNPEVFLSFLFLLSILGLGMYFYRRSKQTDGGLRIISFGIFWFFITLSVESSIIPIADVIFEHRVYLPGVGAFMTFATGAFFLIRAADASKIRNAVAVAVLLIIPVVLSSATFAHNAVWRDEVHLWEDVVLKASGKGRGHFNLAKAYESEGNLLEAIKHYEHALVPDPDDSQTHYNLGIVYRRIGQPQKAIEHFETAIRVRPGYSKAHFNLGLIFIEKKLFDRARKEFEDVLRTKPNDYQARMFLKYAVSNGTASHSK